MADRCPFAYFGHGTAKVDDHFAAWLGASRAPSADERAAIEAAMPQPLREATGDEYGALAWSGPWLHVASGMDFKYVVRRYDAGWVEFDADFDRWLDEAHAIAGLRLVVKNVELRKTHASKWHAQSAQQGPSQLAALYEELAALPEASPWADFVHPMLRMCMAVTVPSKWTAAARAAAIELLRLEGWAVQATVLRDLVMAEPAKLRLALVADLLRSHHPNVLGLFLEAKTYAMLLDDEVFALAMRHASACKLAINAFSDGVPRRLGLHDRVAGTGMPEIPPKPLEWARRMFAVADANGTMAKAAAEPDNVWARSVLRDWRALGQALGLADPA